ncbi:MAG: hypothetical protein OEU86_08325 [Gammaproteobacteria bacterium]|nr:hypothetical protein [Gammaproteobacteria bacterium]
MSEGAVDFSMIRGDWKFHIDYLQNAMDRTLERVDKYSRQLGADADIAEAVKIQAEAWVDLKANANEKGTIPTTDGRLEKFLEAILATKPLCDALEDNDSSETAEEFAEACRQVRSFHDDFIMMKEQRPDSH